MSASVRQLQHECTDHSFPVSTLLRKALILAHQVRDAGFAEWIRHELNGYADRDDDVEYRRLSGDYVALTPNGPIPLHFGDSEQEMNQRLLTAPVTELEELVSSPDASDTFAVTIHIDPRRVRSLNLEPGESVGFMVGRGAIVKCLAAIRDRILEWTFKQQSQRQPDIDTAESFELWLLRYLDEHCASPDQSGKISIDRHWMNSVETKTPHGAVIAAELDGSCDQLEGVISRLEQQGLAGKIRTSTSLHIWITAFGQDQVRGTTMTEPTPPISASHPIDPRKVFVVHGRNDLARQAMFKFLRSIGLHPLEWSEIVHATGQGSPYIGDVLAKGFSIVQAVVVLMTPDDEARLRDVYQGGHEPDYETDLTPQPRQNVLVEAGMALGLFSKRTVIVEIGILRPVSNTFGRHVIRMNNTSERRQDLAQRLMTAGCSVNLEGRDWHKEGDFDGCLPDENDSARIPTDGPELIFAKGAYFEKDAAGNPAGSPYCPTCYERDGRRLHLTHVGHPFPHECPSCGAKLQIDGGEPPGIAVPRRPI